ncbi:MAG: hypothetical protein KBS83_03970 [Lachnospiraceae bacterium]|nr:hypothetical protein [Candidatus Equihabitans merdae]
MKKGISLILIATLALSLMAGCGKKNDAADTNTSAVETEETGEDSLDDLSEDEAEEVDAAFTVDADMPYWMTAAESPVALNDIPC